MTHATIILAAAVVALALFFTGGVTVNLNLTSENVVIDMKGTK